MRAFIYPVLFSLASTAMLFAKGTTEEKQHSPKEQLDIYKKEAKEEATETHQNLYEQIVGQFQKGVNSYFSVEDLSKKEEREAKDKENSLEHLHDKDIAMLQSLAKSKMAKDENLNDLFQSGQSSNPYEKENFSSVDPSNVEKELAVQESSQIVPAEMVERTCEEIGSFTQEVLQDLDVSVHAVAAKKKRVCLGHTIQQHFKKSTEADQFFEGWARKRKEPEWDQIKGHIKDLWFGIKGYEVSIQAKHSDDASSCDHFDEVVVQPAEFLETDHWSNQDQIDRILTFPGCFEVSSIALDYPSCRQVGEATVCRDTWKRKKVFSCDGSKNSACDLLRTMGAELTKSVCKKTNDVGQCFLWEKTYNIGKAAAYEKKTYHFSKDQLLGANDFQELAQYEKNTDFTKAAAQLGLVASLEKEEGPSKEKAIEVFKGMPFSCNRSRMLGGQLFECCKKLDGLAIKLGLASCSEDEKCLAQQRFDGKCVFVGEEKTTMTKEQHFCCFTSKIARLLQEQGRKQLAAKGYKGLDWYAPQTAKGKVAKALANFALHAGPKRANCRGFLLEELEKIDFEAIDFSELAVELGVDQTELLHKLRSLVPDKGKIEKRSQEVKHG